jgi:predicted RecB family nuclease
MWYAGGSRDPYERRESTDAMRLSASDLVRYYSPSVCRRRLDCYRRGLSEAEPGAFEQLLMEMGKRHEAQHRASLEPVLDLSQGSLDERRRTTAAAIERKEPRLYQPVLSAPAGFAPDTEVTGVPDFLLLEDDSYVVRDCKLSRRITEGDHPEIAAQVKLYGWLLEAGTGTRPRRLEVLSGMGEVEEMAYDGATDALQTLEMVRDTYASGCDDYEPVGWSKCGACSYFEHCWPPAEKRRDPAVLPDVLQGIAKLFQEMGITDYTELPRRFDVDSLGELRFGHGKGSRKVGKSAASILRHAEAFTSGKMIVLGPARVPESDNYVMFDLEGLPPQLDAPEKIYLWGTQVFGANRGPCVQATAGFGPEGEQQAWEEFLVTAEEIFARHGDIPFVHWAAYEKTNVAKYIERFGDPKGVGARVLANLCDLLPITKAAVVLPIPSYSIKIVERQAGYKRTLTESGGDWSMAQYIKAVETEDEDLRSEKMDRIKLYNREDLEATWTVYRWLVGLADGSNEPC